MDKWYLPSAWLIALIRVYQKTVYVRSQGVCRYTPTCSIYAVEALRRFGLIGGSVLAVWRILRCNPLCSGGYDPVPERFPFPWRKKNK